MNQLLDVPAPAKLNLFLHIVGRRADGYHLMQSVFVLVDLCDWLDFEIRPNQTITREDFGGSGSELLPANDLVVRAAHLLQQATGCTRGAHIRLTKNIPTQAGMGGGSSDAASCLLALNRLWGTGLSRQALTALGLKLGADVPFFLLGRNAWAEGIGDVLQPIDFPEQRFWVIKPTQGLATASIFTDPTLKRDTERARIHSFTESSVQAKINFGYNDLQPVAQARCPEISECLLWLKSQGFLARMTGSGSAVFAHLPGNLFPPSPPKKWFTAEISSLCDHPLKNWVN